MAARSSPSSRRSCAHHRVTADHGLPVAQARAHLDELLHTDQAKQHLLCPVVQTLQQSDQPHVRPILHGGRSQYTSIAGTSSCFLNSPSTDTRHATARMALVGWLLGSAPARHGAERCFVSRMRAGSGVAWLLLPSLICYPSMQTAVPSCISHVSSAGSSPPRGPRLKGAGEVRGVLELLHPPVHAF